MGMYTEFHFNVELLADTPQQVLDVLRYMVEGDDGAAPQQLPDHEFFRCPRWRHLFLMDSYYFAADTHSTLRFDEVSRSHYLCIRSNLKNYDHEIENFVDWINPFVRASHGDFLGFHRYEESEDPVVIRKVVDS